MADRRVVSAFLSKRRTEKVWVQVEAEVPGSILVGVQPFRRAK